MHQVQVFYKTIHRQFTVNSSESGEYRVLLNATSNDSGTELLTGTVVADELTIELAPTSQYIEGENSLRVVVRSGDREGYDSVVVKVDTPPSTPTLLAAVGFGDGSIPSTVPP